MSRKSGCSELLQDLPATINAILDAALPDRVPVRHHVDGKHRLAQPALRLGRDCAGRQRRAQGEQRIDIVPVELAQRITDVLQRHLRDRPWVTHLRPLSRTTSNPASMK